MQVQYFPLESLLPELHRDIVYFLDTKSMLSLSITSQYFYSLIQQHQQYKAYRLMAYFKSDGYTPNGLPKTIDSYDFMPSDVQSMQTAVAYFLNKFKYMTGSDARFVAPFLKIQLNKTTNQNKFLIKSVEDCLFHVSKYLKFFDGNLDGIVQSYEGYDSEFKMEACLWNETLNLLLSAFTGTEEAIFHNFCTVQSKIEKNLSRSRTFPEGLIELDCFVDRLMNRDPSTNTMYDFMHRDRRKHTYLNELLNKVLVDNRMIQLFLRLSLLPFGNIPISLRSNRDIVLFAIQNERSRILQQKVRFKFVEREKKADFEKITLENNLEKDIDLIVEAVGSLYESSYWGKPNNNALTEDDFKSLGQIIKKHPNMIEVMVKNNKSQGVKWTEDDLIHIVRYNPDCYRFLPMEIRCSMTKLMESAVAMQGENLSHVNIPQNYTNEQKRDLFILAYKNLKNREVSNSSLFSKIPEHLKSDIPFLKDIISHNHAVASLVSTLTIEKEMDFIMFLAPLCPVLDLLFSYASSVFSPGPPRYFIRSSPNEPPTFSNSSRKMQDPTQLIENKEFAVKTLQSFPLQYSRFSKTIQQDREICIIVAKSGCDITLLPAFYNKAIKDRELAEISLRFGSDIFSFDETIYEDPSMFKIALEANPKCIGMSDKFKGDKEMVLFAIDCTKRFLFIPPTFMFFYYFDEALLNDREVVERAILTTATFTDIQSLPKHYLKDKELMLASLKKNGHVYRLLDTELRADLEIAEMAVRSRGSNFSDLPSHLKDNDILLALALERGFVPTN